MISCLSTLELEFETRVGHSDLTCHTTKHSFMINDFDRLLDETNKIISSKRERYGKILYRPEENLDEGNDIVESDRKPKKM